MLFSFLLRVVFFSVVSVNLPENPEEYALKHLNRSARFARCARSLTALADRMLFFLWRRVVSCGCGEAPKIYENSTSKLSKSSPKPSQIDPKTDQNPLKNVVKTRSGMDCASDRFCASVFPQIWRRLGRFRALLRTNLEPSWGVWGRFGCIIVHTRKARGEHTFLNMFFSTYFLKRSFGSFFSSSR